MLKLLKVSHNFGPELFSIVLPQPRVVRRAQSLSLSLHAWPQNLEAFSNIQKKKSDQSSA